MQFFADHKQVGATLVALAMSLSGVSASAEAVIKGVGASFPSRIYERWTQRFMELNPGTSASYTPTGSGDGVKQIKARSVQMGGTDNPLTPAQLAEHKLVQIPLLVGGLVPVINVPGIKSNRLVLSGAVLAQMAMGEITRWDDERITALNPGVSLPSTPIVRVVRQEASGSTEIWTRYLGESSPAFAKAIPMSQKPSWPGNTVAAKGNDGMVSALQGNTGAMAYVSYDRVIKDKLVAVRLLNNQGTAVEASEAGFRAAIVASDVYRKGDDTASLLNMPRHDAWPLTATSYMLLDARPKDVKQAELAARFVYWCFMHGDELTKGTGFAPLPDRVQARLAGRLLQIQGPSGEMPKFQ